MAPTRVILMSCGSYNPPTNMHLRMFEIARDHLHRMGTHVVVGGVISPVHDAYAKKELASATHRCAMLRLALQNSDWIRLSTWETRQNCWTKTRLCLQHHQNLLNSMLSNSNDIMHHIQIEDTEWIPENVKNSSDNTPVQIKLLCGADLLESFGICGLWLEEDIDAIVGEHGLVVITREGSNPNKFIYDSDILSKHMHNICIVTEWIPNEVSSTRIRRALKRSESVRYLLQDSVIDYIYKNEIYDATKTTDTTTMVVFFTLPLLHRDSIPKSKLELSSPNANNYLHLEPCYVSAFLTPSPSDITMGSPSPIEIISAVSIDVPDAVVLRKNLQNAAVGAVAREQFISAITSDNGNVKHVIRVPAYPGQAKQVVIASETGVTRILNEVGDPLDKPMVKLRRSVPSTSGECAPEEARVPLTVGGTRTEGKIDVGQREVSDLGSNVESASVDLGARDDRETRIQPGRSEFSELAPKEDRRLVTESVAIDGKTGEISSLEFKTEIADVDLGAGEDREIIVKIQPGPSSSSELVLKEDRTSTAESIKDKAEVGQREVTNLRIQTETIDADLGLGDDHEIMKITSDRSGSNELRLSECCWLTRENTADDTVEIGSREITSRGRVDVASDSGIDELRAVNKILDRSDSSKVTSVKNTRSIESDAKGKTDVGNKEICFKREIVNIEPDFVNADDVVKVQPTHISHNITVKKDHGSRREEIRIESDEGRIRSEEHLEPSKINEDDGEPVELRPEGIAEATTSSSNASTTSLGGRHECALSDFRVDKEDYQLSQHCLNEDEKPPRSAKSNATNYLNDQKEDIQVSVSAMIPESHEEKRESSTTEGIEDRAMSSEESNRSILTRDKSSEAEENGRFDAENEGPIEESFGILREIDKASETEKETESVAQSAEGRTSCDPNLEINGKYLKSIVNSRKSPRKAREGQARQAIQSEASQSSSVTKTQSPEKLEEDQIHDADADTEDKDRIISDRVISRVEEIFQSSSRGNSTKGKSPKKVEQPRLDENNREFKDQNKSVNDRETSRSGKVFQNSSRTSSTKTKSSRKVEGFQISENERNFNDQNRPISDQASQRSSKMFSTSTKSPKKERQNRHKGGTMKDYNRSINDRVISQLEEVFQNSSRKSLGTKTEGPKNVLEAKNQNRSADEEPFEEFSQRSSKMTAKGTRKAQGQKPVKADNKKIIDDRTKLDEFKDVYTRKVRRYNVPLQGSLDSMIVSDESSMHKPKKEDAFAKKSKSYESIKRIQEVFLGVPNATSNSGSQLDIPDEFCSICCYMNEITFRTEEEVSSPNQETFYTLRSACSSLADDDDDSIDCDICGSLNMQKSADNLEDRVLIDTAHGEIQCELCRLCDEVDDSFEPDSGLVLADKYAYKVIKSIQDDDDSFEIENCGFQSSAESADDRSRVSERERNKEPVRANPRSLFVHGSSTIRDQPRELYFIPKDEIAILTSGTRRAGRKGSLFRKKGNLSENARDNRRYSSMDSLQPAKLEMPAKLDKTLKIARNPTVAGSADNLRISPRDSRRSKSLQRLVDIDVDHLPTDPSTDDLKPERSKKEADIARTIPDNSTQKSSIRDKEAVKMILTQHGIKIISEKETAL